MRKAFHRAGVSAALAVVEDGRQAIEYLNGNGAYADRNAHPLPLLILLDLNLPVVSGFEVLEWVREGAEFAAMPVIIFSSSGRTEDRERASRLGATDYLIKPTSGFDFVEIARLLQARWLPRGPLDGGAAPGSCPVACA